MMIVIPVEDEGVILDALQRMRRKEPESTEEIYKDTTLFVLTPKQGTKRATCVAANHFIVGNLAMIRSSLDRLMK